MGRKLGQIEFYCKVEPILRRVKNLNEATICSFNSFYGTKRKPTDKNSIEWWRRQGYRENQNLWCLGRKLYITKPTENINQMELSIIEPLNYIRKKEISPEYDTAHHQIPQTGSPIRPIYQDCKIK